MQTRDIFGKSTFSKLTFLLLPLVSLLVIFAPAVWLQRRRIRVPRTVGVVFLLYACGLLLPALAAPEPLLAVAGAVIKVALTLSLVTFGLWLGQEKPLAWLIPGITITLIGSLLFSTVSDGYQPLQERLTHPYYTSVTLGFAGAIALWLGAFQSRLPIPWRLAGVVTGALLLIFSGSRGGLVAAAAGLVAGLTVWLWRRRSKRLVAGGVLALGAALLLLGQLPALQQPVLNRLASLDSAGRDVIWQEAIAAIHERPIAGYGTFQFGPRLAPLGQIDDCSWWKSLEDVGRPCPAIVQKFNNVWLIGHNAVLQQWGEGGIFGLLGHFILYAFLIVHSWRVKSSLAVAILIGFFTGDLTDNVTVVPGPFITAVPWIVGGLALTQASDDWYGELPKTNLLAGTLILLGSFPLWVAHFGKAPQAHVRLVDVQSSSVWKTHEPYPLLSVIMGPVGNYRIQIRLCDEQKRACHSTVPVSFTIPAEGQKTVQLTTLAFPNSTARKSRLELIVRAGQDSFWRDTRLAARDWGVEVWPDSR